MRFQSEAKSGPRLGHTTAQRSEGAVRHSVPGRASPGAATKDEEPQEEKTSVTASKLGPPTPELAAQ